MAKWRYDLAGSSSHIHASLWEQDGRTPLFADPKGAARHVALMRRYPRRPARATRATSPISSRPSSTPTNASRSAHSRRRGRSGAIDNRTAGFRLCGEGTKAIRVECRIGGADLNPYLAFAALIAAGLAGIEEKLELEAAFVGDAYHGEKLREIPKTLREATETLRGSKMLRAAFGDDVVDHYVHAAEWEQSEYDRRITDWELKRGFERS